MRLAGNSPVYSPGCKFITPVADRLAGKPGCKPTGRKPYFKYSSTPPLLQKKAFSTKGFGASLKT